MLLPSPAHYDVVYHTHTKATKEPEHRAPRTAHQQLMPTGGGKAYVQKLNVLVRHAGAWLIANVFRRKTWEPIHRDPSQQLCSAGEPHASTNFLLLQEGEKQSTAVENTVGCHIHGATELA